MDKEVKELYRYEAHARYHWDGWGESHHLEGVEVVLLKFRVMGTTPCGVHIIDANFKSRWVSLHARKRYAYETKELAMESFKIRNSRRIMHLKNSLKEAQMARAALERDDLFMPNGLEMLK